MENNLLNEFKNTINLDSEYSMLTGSTNMGIAKHRLDKDLTFLWANEYFYSMFGYTKEEYAATFQQYGSRFFKNDPEDWKIIVDAVNDTIKSGKTRYESIVRMRHKDGRRLWISFIGNITDDLIDGVPISYSIMLDVTAQMQPLFEQNVAYESLPAGIAKYRIAKNGFVFIDHNKRFKEIFGDKNIFENSATTHNIEASTLLTSHELMRKGEPVSFVLSPTNDDGKALCLSINGKCVDNIGHDPVYLFVCLDITEITEKQHLLEQANQRLEKLAFVDSLTLGPNKNKFQIDVENAISNSTTGSFSFVWMNLQKFKLVNDMAGTEEGDKTLKHIFDSITSALQEGEFVSRIESDNFAMLLHASDNDKIKARIESMVYDINGFNVHLTSKYFLTFTVGVYNVDDHSLPLTQIQDRANVARKSILSKNQTGLCTCVFYDDVTRIELMHEKEMENRMRDALEKEEFLVYFQPKVSVTDHSIVGAEALVRWNIGGKDIIPPDRFIPLFEKNGFIVDLDLYVFNKVCLMVNNWIKKGLKPIPISVNMSRVHLHNTNPIDAYENILNKYDIPANLFEIELTESMTIDNNSIIVETITNIHNKGFLCSIDDFGSGYSSLNMLKNIRADTLKLDREFIASSIDATHRDEAIVRSIADLAKDLGMSTIAEGVETKEQLDLIRRSGCDQIQGYIFSKPLPIMEFEELLSENKKFVVE